MIRKRHSYRRTALAACVALAAFAAGSPGCYLEPTPATTTTTPTPTEAGEIGTPDYQPLYYDGYPVYYDDYGRPYYYVGGTALWIPASYPYYGYYVAHWRRYRPYYHRWYHARGYRYRTYRRHPGYYRRGGAARRGTVRGSTRRGGAGGHRRR